jgi:hypothetical protein
MLENMELMHHCYHVPFVFGVHMFCNWALTILIYRSWKHKIALYLTTNHYNQKGGSRKPTAMTRVPTDPSSCDLTIHRNCTDT